MLLTLLIFFHLYSRSNNKDKYGWVGGGILILQILLFTPTLLSFFIPTLSGLSMIAALIITFLIGQSVIYTGYNSYGLLKILHDEKLNANFLFNGRTLHGSQCLDADLRNQPTSYFHPIGPVGQFFSIFENEIGDAAIGSLGLGTGTIACYVKPGQKIDIYEINPLIKEVALNPRYFTFLTDCRGKLDIIMGNAIFTLKEARLATYRVLVVDIYNDGKIPPVFMDKDAIQLYLDKTDAQGFLLLHVSSKNIDFSAKLKEIIEPMNLEGYLNIDEDETHFLKRLSTWVVIGKDPAAMQKLAGNSNWISLKTIS